MTQQKQTRHRCQRALAAAAPRSYEPSEASKHRREQPAADGRSRSLEQSKQPTMMKLRACFSFAVVVLFADLLVVATMLIGQADSWTTTTAPCCRRRRRLRRRSDFACFDAPPSFPRSTTSPTLRSKSSSYSLPLRSLPLTQVISDVDDTLKSSGGVNVGGVALGGIDVQYRRGEVYPGVAEFIFELSRGPSIRTTSSASSSSRKQRRAPSSSLLPPKVAILTARAEEFKAALELKESSKLAAALREAGTKSGVEGWGLGPVLYGSVVEWIVQNRKGLRKVANFERLITQDPTGRILQYVYLGDTGELDQEAGETMLREYPEVCKAVFLHVVSDDPAGPGPVPAPKWINGRPIVFFRTYVGAAAAAAQLGYVSLGGLQNVVRAAKDRLADVPQTSDKWTDLNLDIDRANMLLEA